MDWFLYDKDFHLEKVNDALWFQKSATKIKVMDTSGMKAMNPLL